MKFDALQNQLLEIMRQNQMDAQEANKCKYLLTSRACIKRSVSPALSLQPEVNCVAVWL